MGATSGRRRRLVAASVILAVSVVAAACGSSSKSSSGTTVAGSNTSVAGVGSTAPPSGEINVFLIPSPSSTAIQSFIPEFTKQTGIKVNFTETPYGEAHQKELLSYQQKKGAYDVAQFDNTFLAAFGAAKVMTPLDDYLAKSSAYDIADFSQGQQDYGKYGGSTLGLTLSTEPMIQWYRTDIYDALGLKPATTWDEFKSNAEKVKAAGKGDGALIDFGPAATWWWMTLVWSFGGKLYDDNLQPTVNTPEAVKATEYMKSLLPLAPEGALSVDGDGVTGKFISQDIGAMIQYSGYYGFMQDPKTNKYVGKIGTAKMPMGTADITHLAGWNIGIPADSKNKDAAWKFLEFVLGKANAINFLNAGAAAIGRESITSNADLVAKEPYLKLLNIPSTSRIERYPQLKVWPEMDKAIQDTITNIFTGKSDVKSGLDGLEKALGPILAGEKG